MSRPTLASPRLSAKSATNPLPIPLGCAAITVPAATPIARSRRAERCEDCRPMKAIIFAGPTLPPAIRPVLVPAIEWRPPVRQGDVYRAALTRLAIIGIVDGYFEAVPTVWHKEVLWAMAEGIHVFGAASIGALRAAELDRFGMRGIGRI